MLSEPYLSKNISAFNHFRKIVAAAAAAIWSGTAIMSVHVPWRS